MNTYKNWYNRISKAWKERAMTRTIAIQLLDDGSILIPERDMDKINDWSAQTNCSISVEVQNHNEPKEGATNAQGSVLEGTVWAGGYGSLVRPADGGMLLMSDDAPDHIIVKEQS